MAGHFRRPGRAMVGRSGLVATAYTAACCLGVSGAVSLASSVGATALTHDATLQPLLAAALAVTIGGCAWTYWRGHRRPAPLVLSLAAGALVYAALFGPFSSNSHAAGQHEPPAHHSQAGPHADEAVHHTEPVVTSAAATGSHGGASASLLVWTGLVVLLGAQVWDGYRLRTGCPRPRRGRHALPAGRRG